MSRTFAHRPYWVVLNDEGTNTNHDHLRLGRPIIKRRYLRDENNKAYKVTEPLFARADDILKSVKRVPYYDENGNRIHYYLDFRDGEITEWKESVNPLGISLGTWRVRLISEAAQWCSKNQHGKKLQIGTYQKWAYVDEVIGHVADHCTQGEKLPDDSWGWYRNSALPCTPALPHNGALHRTWSRYGGARGMITTAEHGNRGQARATLGKMKKSWNAGEDVDDFDEEIRLSNHHRHALRWYW